MIALTILIVLQRSLSPEAMNTWGWRVPFAFGGLLAVVAYIIRRHMDESESFVRAKGAGLQGGTRALWARHPRECLIILGLTAGGSLGFYIYTTYMQKFLTNTASFSKADATEISAISMFLFMAFQPLAGWLSDRIGRKACMLVAFGCGAIGIWPLMQTISQTQSFLFATLLIGGGILVHSAYTAVSSVAKAELFPTEVRALGVALPFALANAAFGGTAEYIALWFKSRGMESGFYAYAAVILAIGFVATVLMPDTRRHSRILED
jgi:MHS family alpha-ketoglutarate permease-like MFS transporter